MTFESLGIVCLNYYTVFYYFQIYYTLFCSLAIAVSVGIITDSKPQIKPLSCDWNDCETILKSGGSFLKAQQD